MQVVADKLNEAPAERFAVFPSSSLQVESSSQSATAETSHTNSRMRNPFDFLTSKISNGIQRFIRALKCFSQIFVYKDGAEEEMEMVMEIGFPTDVKHLTHIGYDGSTTTNPVKGLENLTDLEFVASHSISLKQFELAMAAQAADQLHHQSATVSVDLHKSKFVCQDQHDC